MRQNLGYNKKKKSFIQTEFKIMKRELWSVTKFLLHNADVGGSLVSG